jgi:hypothetical protein
MNNFRGAALVFVFGLLLFRLYALDVNVAHISYIDETDDRVDQRSAVRQELLRVLREIETGSALLFLSMSNELIQAPQSLADALRICRTEKLDYLLYGFVAKKEYTFQTEIKLFDYAKRTVIKTFYASDDHDNYERMLHDIAGKIISYINEEFHLNIVEKRPVYRHFLLPLSLGYWTPLTPSWTDLLLGTVVLEGGIRFIPRDRLFVAFGMSFYLSLETDLSYRLGVGNPNAYDALDHTLAITAPARLHMKLSDEQNLFFGLGIQYALDFLQIKQPYRSGETNVYSAVGFLASFGYEHRLNEAWYMLIDDQIEVKLYDTPMPVYSLRVGFMYLMNTEEVIPKW